MLKLAYRLRRLGQVMLVVGASVLVGGMVGGLGAIVPVSVGTESLIGLMLLVAVALAVIMDTVLDAFAKKPAKDERPAFF